MPDFREGHFVMQADAASPGASLEEMSAMGARLTRQLLALPYVATVSQQIGRAEMGEDTSGPHQSEFHIELKEDANVDQTQAEAKMRDLVGAVPASRPRSSPSWAIASAKA